MNIIVKAFGTGRFYCRPDTTWEREDKDLYLPDAVSGYLWTPVLFARISKAGKCIGRKFADRYYDAVSYGILLYVKDLLCPAEQNAPEAISLAAASCTDHTSVLPFPMYNKVTLEDGTNIFSVSKDGQEIYSTAEGSAEIIEDAISGASALISLRIGDILAVELKEMARQSKRNVLICRNKRGILRQRTFPFQHDKAGRLTDIIQNRSEFWSNGFRPNEFRSKTRFRLPAHNNIMYRATPVRNMMHRTSVRQNPFECRDGRYAQDPEE